MTTDLQSNGEEMKCHHTDSSTAVDDDDAHASVGHYPSLTADTQLWLLSLSICLRIKPTIPCTRSYSWGHQRLLVTHRGKGVRRASNSYIGGQLESRVR